MTTETQEPPEQAVITGRCQPSELIMIDVATALTRKTRSSFVADATIAAAKQVLIENGVELPTVAA